MVVEAVGRLDHHGRGQSRPGQASRSGGLVRESRRLYRRWEAEQPDDEPQATTDESETTLLAATTLEEAEEAARADLINYMAETPPYRFQDLVGKLLEAMGYHVVWIAPKGPDGGLDLAAQTDPLGVTGPRIKGQVKRRPDSKVTEDELRSFVSLIETDDVGVFISLGGFTREATRHGRETSRRVTLIDGERLLDLWVEHYGEDQTMWRPPLKILIVCDRLLTGFDAPCCTSKRRAAPAQDLGAHGSGNRWVEARSGSTSRRPSTPPRSQQCRRKAGEEGLRSAVAFPDDIRHRKYSDPLRPVFDRLEIGVF